MITAKSCLAIRSGRFNERNAMLKKYFMLLTACLFFTAAWLLFAAEAGALSFSQSTGLVSLKVTPEYKTLSPASETIDIIAEADIKPGWHLYWDNPGDIGGPTSLSFFESPQMCIRDSLKAGQNKLLLKKFAVLTLAGYACKRPPH